MVSVAAKLSNLPLEVKSLGRKRTKNKSHKQFTLQSECNTVHVFVTLCLHLTSKVINLFFLQQTDSIVISLQH